MFCPLQWQYILSIQPNPNKNDPNDDKEILDAQESIGDYKLKSDPMYSSNTTVHENTSRKFLELLKSRKETDRLRNEYNQKVIELRNKKIDLINYIQYTKEKLKAIHEELPKEFHQNLDEKLSDLENPPNLRVNQSPFKCYICLKYCLFFFWYRKLLTFPAWKDTNLSIIRLENLNLKKSGKIL